MQRLILHRLKLYELNTQRHAVGVVEAELAVKVQGRSSRTGIR